MQTFPCESQKYEFCFYLGVPIVCMYVRNRAKTKYKLCFIWALILYVCVQQGEDQEQIKTDEETSSVPEVTAAMATAVFSVSVMHVLF